MSLLLQFTLILALSLLVFALAKPCKISHVFMMILLGILVGPAVLDFPAITQYWPVLSELGFILLIFYLGFQLKPSQVWDTRYQLFGFASLITLGTVMSLTAVSWLVFNTSLMTSLLLGLAFSWSAQYLIYHFYSEYKVTEVLPPHQTLINLHILLFIPAALLLKMVSQEYTAYQSLAELTLIVAMISGLLLFARYFMQPVLSHMQQLDARLLPMTALGIVFSIFVLADAFDISLLLAALFSGMLLAESDENIQLQQFLTPFTGFMGSLVFILLGTQLIFEFWSQHIELILSFTAALVTSKIIMALAIGYQQQWAWQQSVKLGLVYAQAGELSFVLVTLMYHEQLMSHTIFQISMAVICLSLCISTALHVLFAYLPQLSKRQTE